MKVSLNYIHPFKIEPTTLSRHGFEKQNFKKIMNKRLNLNTSPGKKMDIDLD